MYGDLSTTATPDGMDALRGAQLRVAEANAAGGIGGRPVELLSTDARQSQAEAVKAFTDLVQQGGVCTVIGVGVANGGIAVGPVAELMKVPFLSLGIDDRVTTPELRPGSPAVFGPVRQYSFMVRPSAALLASSIAAFAAERFPFQRYATLFDPADPVSRIQAASFEAGIVGAGRAVVAKTEMPADGSDFGPALDTITRAAAAAVYLCGSSAQNAAAVKAIRARSLTALPLGNQSWDGDFLTAAGSAASNTWYATGAWNADPALADLSAKSTAAFGQPARPLTAWGWDAVGLVLAAVRRAGSSAPARVRDALEQTTGFKAVFGQLDMDRRTHRPAALPVAIMHAMDGGAVAVEPRYLVRPAGRLPAS